MTELIDTLRFICVIRANPATLIDTLRFICVIRANPATDSDAIRPPVPTEVGHLFRSNPATVLG